MTRNRMESCLVEYNVHTYIMMFGVYLFTNNRRRNNVTEPPKKKLNETLLSKDGKEGERYTWRGGEAIMHCLKVSRA